MSMTFSTTSIKKGWVGHVDDMDGGVVVYWHVHVWAAGDDAGRIAGHRLGSDVGSSHGNAYIRIDSAGHQFGGPGLWDSHYITRH